MYNRADNRVRFSCRLGFVPLEESGPSLVARIDVPILLWWLQRPGSFCRAFPFGANDFSQR